MTLTDFIDTLCQPTAPPISPLLQALWWDRHGDWDRAHQLAQDIDDKAGAWVHAYLHRKEGDIANARYWYRRAGEAEATDSVEAEWTRIASALLTADAEPSTRITTN